MPEAIDRKYKIVAQNPCKKGSRYTEQDGMFFAAKDAALVPTLTFYYEECQRVGCKEEHLESVLLLIERVRDYQSRINKKVADTQGQCEVDRCIGGIGL